MVKELEKQVRLNKRTYTQIKRDTWKAMYLSNDGYYEVFRVTVLPDREIFGQTYPAKERYPSNSDFGVNAWCTKNKERAEEIYNNLKENETN